MAYYDRICFTTLVNYFVHNIYIRLSLKKNGLSVRNIGFVKYFLTSICCVVILIFSLLITHIVAAPFDKPTFFLRPRLHGYIFKSFRFHFVAFSNRSTLDCVFKCLRFGGNRFHRFREGETVTTSSRFQMKTYPCNRGLRIVERMCK